MTEDQAGGIILVVLGIFVIAFRRFFYIGGGGDVDIYRPENNLANPQRPPTSREDQLFILIGGLAFVVAGLLLFFGLPPFA